MERHKEDVIWQGLYNYKDADWTKCRDAQCPLISKCEKHIFAGLHIPCIYRENDLPLVQIQEKEKLSELDNLFASHNVTSNAFLDAVIDHIVGDSTPALEISFAYFTSRFDPPDADTTIAIDDHQVGSNITPTYSNSGRTITITINLATSDCNCLDTTVDDASFTPTTTQFDLDSVTGLDTGGGDMIEINLGSTYGLVRRKIDSISTNRVTLTQALPIAPSDGDVVRQILSNVYICMANNTVISADAYGIFKSSSISRQITATLRLIRN